MPATINGYLEVDIKRGVIWFNSDQGKCFAYVDSVKSRTTSNTSTSRTCTECQS